MGHEDQMLSGSVVHQMHLPLDSDAEEENTEADAAA